MSIVLGAAEAVHGVVHLDALPAVVVVVLVVDEVRRLPARAEERVVALVVGHEEELVDLAPVAPLEAAVELGVAAQGGVGLAHRAVGHARPADAAQGHVVVDLVALPRVVVEVEGQEGLVEDAREGREALLDGRHGVEPAHGHLGQAVAVRVVEGERVLPVEARVGQRLRGPVDLQEEARRRGSPASSGRARRAPSSTRRSRTCASPASRGRRLSRRRGRASSATRRSTTSRPRPTPGAGSTRPGRRPARRRRCRPT